MTFKCTIPGVSLKVFGRAIQSLSKIGDELYFEPREDGLFLRSVNSCRSAYACFQFSPNFFDHYVDVSTPVETEEEDESFRCKIGMKSVMTVFRNLATIDKTVEKCRASLNTAEDRLVFQMYCRHGIIKTHKLAFIECETLQAVSSKDKCPNKVTSLPRLLCEAVLNFQANQEEITLIVRPDFLALQNYVDDEQDVTKVMRTEMTLSPDEFDQYQVGLDTDITFCLKELRAVLSFADISGLPLTLQFDTAGKPITFSITGDLSYEATFVLATLAAVEDSDETSAPPLHSQAQNHKSSKASREKSHSRATGVTRSLHQDQKARGSLEYGEESRRGVTSVRRPEAGEDDQGMSATLEVEDVTITDPATFVNGFELRRVNMNEPNKISHSNQTKLSIDKHREAAQSHPSTCNGWKDERPGAVSQKSGTSASRHIHGNGENPDSCDNRADLLHSSPPQGTAVDNLESGDVGSPVIPVQNADFSQPGDIDGEEEEEEVPATPPSKKFRSLFFGTQSSTQPSQSQSNTEILAPNSDSDD